MQRKDTLLEIKNLSIIHKKHSNKFIAVKNLSLTVSKGETVSLVGQSGCGKTSVASAILGLIKHKTGTITYKGKEKFSHKNVQMIFQDPYSSLNPRMTIEEIIEEPLIIYKIGNKTERKERVKELMSQVSLPKHYKYRYPHELSGGERQRVSIARALSPNPELLICDEPTHALDVSVQASIINLLKDLKDKFGLSLLFISHDLSLVHNISDRCLVMYKGQIMETGPVEEVFFKPLHPYTQKLLSSIPHFNKDIPLIIENKKETKKYQEPVEITSPILHSYVENLQQSIALLTKKIESNKRYTRCPYIQKCKNRQLQCETSEFKSLDATMSHKSLCILEKVEEKESILQ